MSVFDGHEAIVDKFFKVQHIGKNEPHYKNKEAALLVSRKNDDYGKNQGVDFVAKIFEIIKTNSVPNRISKSKENWRNTKQLKLDDGNTSREKILEKKIAKIPGNDWFNQVPVASGLSGPSNDRKIAIDLVRRISDFEYDFIELKICSDNPLYASIEIVLYGLMYVFFRSNKDVEKLDKPLLKARHINLVVLAPKKYYSGYKLGFLENLFSTGLNALLDKMQIDLKMNFEFKCFQNLDENNIGEFNNPEKLRLELNKIKSSKMTQEY